MTVVILHLQIKCSMVIVCAVDEGRDGHGKISSETRPSSRIMFQPTALTTNMEITAISFFNFLGVVIIGFSFYNFLNVFIVRRGRGPTVFQHGFQAQTA